MKLASENGGIDDNARWRKIVYGSVAPFAMFQNRKNSTFAFSKVPSGALSNADWYVEVWLFALFVCDLVELLLVFVPCFDFITGLWNVLSVK